jgi:DEAD/DEAH box helicase domain-containing protein
MPQYVPLIMRGCIAQYSGIDIVTLNADGAFIDPDLEAINRLRPVLSTLLPNEMVSSMEASADRILAPFLQLFLEQVPIVRRLMELVYENDLLSIGDLSHRLWNDDTKASNEATILLLRLTAAARLHPNESPLIPNRLHFLVRAPQGLSACLNPSCTGPAQLQAECIGSLQAPRDRCVYCNAITLPVHRCKACGQWALAGHENPDTVESGDFAEATERRYYLVADSGGKDLSVVVVNPETGEHSSKGTGTRLFRAPCPEHGATCNDPSQCTQQACPNCAASWGASPDDTDEDEWALQIQPLRGAERLALSVATETVLYGMPVYPDISRDWKPGKGRRLLCFSDSRREAARLGPLLTSQHETWVVRSAIANTLATYKSTSADYINRQIQRYEADADDLTLPQVDRDEASRSVAILRKQRSTAALGVPFTDFARSFADGPHISEILDRDLAEKHSEWRQERWKENRQSVASHAEALIAQELDNPLRTAVSTEAVGILELVFPGLVELPLPARFEEKLPSDEIRNKLAGIWPDILAALLVSCPRNK